MGIRQIDGRVVVSEGVPVYSRREYIIRHFERSPWDGYEERVRKGFGIPPHPTTVRKTDLIEPAIVFEDKETGLLTTDVAKFEAWLYAGEKEEDR